MGLLKTMFGSSQWYEAHGVKLKHGTHVEVGGRCDETKRYAGRTGTVAGVTKSSQFVHVDGWVHSLQRLFLVDLGGLCIQVPGSDVELAQEHGQPKGDGQHWQ